MTTNSKKNKASKSVSCSDSLRAKLDKDARLNILKIVAFEDILNSVVEDLGKTTLEDWDNLSAYQRINYKLSTSAIGDAIAWFLERKRKLDEKEIRKAELEDLAEKIDKDKVRGSE